MSELLSEFLSVLQFTPIDRSTPSIYNAPNLRSFLSRDHPDNALSAVRLRC